MVSTSNRAMHNHPTLPTTLQLAEPPPDRAALPEGYRSIAAESPPRLAIVPHLAAAKTAADPAELQAQAQELLHQADTYLLQGQVEVAIAHYRRALQFDVHLVDAHQGLAEALTQQGDLDAAAHHYQTAIDLLPLPALAPPNLVPTAEPTAEPAVEQLPWYEQAAFYLQQAKALCDRQQWQETIAACEQAAKLLTPQTALTYRLMGRALQAEKQFEAAERYYSQSLAIEADLAETYARLGSVYVEQNRLTEAATFLEQAIELDPEFAGAFLKLAEVWKQLGDLVQAADCFYRAYRLEPSWATAKEFLQLGNQMIKQNKLEQAIDCYQQAIALAPSSPNGYYNLAIAMGKQHNWSAAIRLYRQAIERQPQNFRFHAALGQALMKLNRWSDAIACYQRICDLLPDPQQLQTALVQMERCQRALMAQSYGKMAQKLATSRQWQAAIDCYRQAIDRDSETAEFQVGLAQALAALAQWEEAATCYQAAIALQPAQAEHRIALAEVFIKLGRFEKAARCYHQAVADPAKRAAEPIPAAPTVDRAYTVL
ncbi:tetratricopeptide repeat protein [Microcoleus sp. FACHB-1515]|uniref:tetratricopeptide repeat protein n=1 Tax=Cyanophyceae TaxID=3028117 RepID=UPI0016888015|nr:tetratricopeptide repeat protein [Microcoleus sp. FACHB-1515]MBD2088995.1 tetratricopeptide repeat protein [Microcoleus sp. FACHB-1515]